MPAAQTRTVPTMGGWAMVTVVGGETDLLAGMLDRLQRLDRLWSRFRPDSEVSRLNSAGGAWVEVSAETVILIDALRAAHAATFGAFDPTLLPDLVALGDTVSRTDPAAVTSLPPDARAGGDIARIEIDGNGVRLPVGLTLDSGGLGKGLAADLIVHEALSRGVDGVLVDIDGDLATAGRAPRGGDWCIGIEDPLDPDRRLETFLLAAGGVATSSRLRRRWNHRGSEVHHLIDPETHASAVTEVVSATVRAPSAALAEAYATCAFVWQVPELLGWLPRVGAEAVLVLEDGRIVRSAGWEQAA